MSKPPKPLSEEPRSEPEIIPPGQAEQSHPRMRAYTHRIYIGKPSPLGIILVTLILGLLSAAMLVVLFGAFLFLLPLAVLFFTGVIVVGLCGSIFVAFGVNAPRRNHLQRSGWSNLFATSWTNRVRILV